MRISDWSSDVCSSDLTIHQALTKQPYGAIRHSERPVLRPTEPLPLNHSWPLYALRDHLAPVMLDDRIARDDGALAERGLGLWHCDLGDDSLNWTDGVYDIFGLERGTAVPRPLAVSLSAPDSCAAMERLRAYALRHRRGFTRCEGGRVGKKDGVTCQ